MAGAAVPEVVACVEGQKLRLDDLEVRILPLCELGIVA